MTASLDDMVARVRGTRADAAASLEISLGRLVQQLNRQAQREAEMDRAVQPLLMPAVQFTTTGGALVQPTQATLLGPEDGQIWDVRRVSVAGLAKGTGPSVAAEGSVTNPGALATIASISFASLVAAAPAGTTWVIQWIAALEGTIAAGDANNMRLNVVGPGLIEVGAFPGVVGEYPQDQVATPIGSGSILVQSVGAASGVSATYAAQITATPVGPNFGDVVSLYREPAGGGGGNPQNFLKDFSAAGTSPGPTWGPGGGLTLRSPDQLLLAGSGLVTASVMLSLEGNVIEAPWMSRYLL